MRLLVQTRLFDYFFLLVLICFCQGVWAYNTITDVLSADPRFETLLAHLQRTRLIPVINKLTAGTLFAPDNSAFANYHGDITNDTLLYHLLPSQIEAEEFHHHQVLESSFVLENYLQNNAGQRLLVRRPTTTTTRFIDSPIFINDARIIDADLEVNKNTNIHVINKVLKPPAMLAPSLEAENSDLYQMMDKIGLVHLLGKGEPFTVFYAKQSILNHFNDVEKAYLLSRYGDEDLMQMLDYLILRGDHYSEDFIGKKEYKTISGEVLTVEGNLKKKVITVNGERIVHSDLLAANGVLHEVEAMPITEKLLFDIRKYLYGLNSTKFVSLLDKYGLGYYLASGVTNFTVLAPDNDSIDEGAIPDNFKKSWLSYHLLHGQWHRSLLKDKQLISSEFKSPLLKDKPQQVPVSLSDARKTDIFFGDARVHDKPLTINNNVIYQLSNPMALPYDVFSSLVVDLELSSFIATLYVSGVVDKIKSAKGITLFAPTNQAYKSLGLVATYLVSPTGRQDLQTTLQYHAAKALLYDHDLRISAYSVMTLTGIDTLQVGGTDDQGRIIVGDYNQENNGTIHQSNVLMTNGVVHKIDRVMMPPSVLLTHRKMLVGMDAHRVLDWFNDFPWLEHKQDSTADSDNEYILLAPTDHAFTQLDERLGNGWEKRDPEAYERLVRLHVIPKSQQLQRRSLLSGEIEEYGTLLSDRDRVVIHDRGYYDEEFVQVMGQTGQGAHARVLAKGKLRKYAQVIEIDTVLVPVSRGVFGLPWIWSVVVICLLVALALGAVLGGAYYFWRRYRRHGYERIAENDVGVQPQQEEQGEGQQPSIPASASERETTTEAAPGATPVGGDYPSLQVSDSSIHPHQQEPRHPGDN